MFMLSESFGVEEKGRERGLILPSDRSVKTRQKQLPIGTVNITKIFILHYTKSF